MRFRCMLNVFHLDVAKVDLVLHMLQVLYTYVASVCFKRMLQVFYLDIPMLQWLYMYVASVSPVSDLCCKCFI